jgi:hypothetical protein
MPDTPTPENQEIAFCPACGTRVRPGARFCVGCGGALYPDDAGPTAAAAAAPEPPGSVTPAPPPPPPQTGETVVGIITTLGLRKGLSVREYNLLVTTERLVFLRVTTQMLNEAAREAKQAAKAQGKGFFGQWGAVIGSRALIRDRHLQTPVDVLLSEQPESYFLPLAQVRRIAVNEADVDDDEVTQGSIVIWAPKKMRFTMPTGSAKEVAQTLRRVLGGVVE